LIILLSKLDKSKIRSNKIRLIVHDKTTVVIIII
jgi:hypothetical protein